LKAGGIILFGSFVLASCSTPQSRTDRMVVGAGIGVAVGAGGGAILSPNDESKGLNALVFGLSGALIGGMIGVLTGKEPEKTPETLTLEEREAKGNPKPQELVLPIEGSLPPYLKERIAPTVVEEFIEKDLVGEDGTLHAPHKVYRIKRPAEFIAKPEVDSGGRAQ
jgi:hypothetical protein